MRRMLTAISAVTLLFAASCAGPQKSIYFRDNSPVNPAVTTQKIDKIKEAIIQPDDILAINVTSPSSIVEKRKHHCGYFQRRRNTLYYRSLA